MSIWILVWLITSTISIYAIIRINVWYCRFLKSLSPPELAAFRKQEMVDMRIW
jgi:hypothetical protein